MCSVSAVATRSFGGRDTTSANTDEGSIAPSNPSLEEHEAACKTEAVGVGIRE